MRQPRQRHDESGAAGQMLASVGLDLGGLFDVPRRAISALRLTPASGC